MGNDCVLPVLTSLISILRIHCESVGKVPPDKPFSVLQAVTQSVQPLLHLPLSINIPQRTLLSAPLLAPSVAGAACATSIKRTPGAIKAPAIPAVAAIPKNPRRLAFGFACVSTELVFSGVEFSEFMASPVAAQRLDAVSYWLLIQPNSHVVKPVDETQLARVCWHGIQSNQS